MQDDAQAEVAGGGSRIDSIDILRGIVVLLMALDHTRDFFHMTGFSPTDLEKTSLPLYFTRFVTHFCAPTFVLLAGLGAALYARSRPRGEVVRFLLERGLLLILLEFLAVNPTWPYLYRPNWQMIFVQVIWVLGVSMVILAGLLHFRIPRGVLLAGSLLLIFGHNLLDNLDPGKMGSFAPVWAVLHENTRLQLSDHLYFWVIYPLLPWPAVMVLGYLLGELYTDGSPAGAARRKRVLLAAGAGAVALFVALRFANSYGDPGTWASSPRGWPFTVASFLRTYKYPPSLLFLLMTLGPALLALPLLEKAKGRLADFFLDYGRAPLFFYLLHFPLLHLAEIVWSKVFYGSNNLTLLAPKDWPASYSPSLLRTYLVWLALVFAMRPACRAFLAYKRRSTRRWVRYF